MFNFALLCIAMGLLSLVLGIGVCFEKPIVRLYDKFDNFMEKAFEKIFGM